MMPPDQGPGRARTGLLRPLDRRPIGQQWAALLALSGILVVVLEVVRLPAALLLGPMAAAIVLAVAGGTVRVPPLPFYVAQGVIGCMVARGIPLEVLAEIGRDWPLFLGGVLWAIVVATGLGWLLTRWRVLPGTTAVWGFSPGAAMTMTLLSQSYGADMRLVAFMQYLRVLCVVVTASVVARLWTGTSGGSAPAIDWFPAIAWHDFAATAAVAAVGIAAALRFKVPAGPMLLPLALGVALQGAGWLTVELPPWLLALSYAAVGWAIGLRFTRPILAHAARALPRVLASILALIVLCGAFAAVLVVAAGIDPLTAYLATSPGGMDSAAIIAASSDVDLAFVMAMQTARVLVVILTGPSLARFVARRAGTAAAPP